MAPPELRLTGAVYCDRTEFVGTLVRSMTATNVGGVTMKNTTLQEINGQRRFSAALASPANAPAPSQEEDTVFTACPKCGGPIYDNREANQGRKNPWPSFKCKDTRGCQWCEW